MRCAPFSNSNKHYLFVDVSAFIASTQNFWLFISVNKTRRRFLNILDIMIEVRIFVIYNQFTIENYGWRYSTTIINDTNSTRFWFFLLILNLWTRFGNIFIPKINIMKWLYFFTKMILIDQKIPTQMASTVLTIQRMIYTPR